MLLCGIGVVDWCCLLSLFVVVWYCFLMVAVAAVVVVACWGRCCYSMVCVGIVWCCRLKLCVCRRLLLFVVDCCCGVVRVL